jgi:hypothetical protein
MFKFIFYAIYACQLDSVASLELRLYSMSNICTEMFEKYLYIYYLWVWNSAGDTIYHNNKNLFQTLLKQKVIEGT